MRIPCTCFECLEERINAGEAGEALAKPEYYLADLEDDGAYVGTCTKNHKIRVVMQNLRHELLYESGIMALHCSFHREAVGSIASALERFFEFAVRVLLAHNGVGETEVDAAWKAVHAQSERQVGAFLFLYLSAMKRPFTTPSTCRPLQKMSEFRNDVVHKGKIPTRAQALEYAREVFEIVLTVTAELEALDPENLSAVWHRTGPVASRMALDKKDGPAQRGADGRFRSAGMFVTTMLAKGATGTPAQFDERFAMSKHYLSMWGLQGRARD